MTLPFGQTVTVHRYAMDRYGDRSETMSFTVPECGFAPRVSTENTARADVVTADAELYAPEADILATDVVELADGTRWEVTGDPQHWTQPMTGWQPGIVVMLRRMTGE